MEHSMPNHSRDFHPEKNVFPSRSKGPQLCWEMGHPAQNMHQDTTFPLSRPTRTTKNSKRGPAGETERRCSPPEKRRKTQSHDNIQESASDGDDGSGTVEVDKKKEEKFACPFYRKDPIRFLDCIHAKMLTIPIVKQHLKRRHAANSYCSICKKGFSSSKLFEDHIRTGSCDCSNVDDLDSIPPQILDKLRLRPNRRETPTTQWQAIWVLLFREPKTTPRPLLDGILKEFTEIIRDVWSQDGKKIVSNHLQGQGMPVVPDQLFSLLPKLLDTVEDRFETKPLEHEIDEQRSESQELLKETTTGESDNSQQGPVALDQYPYHDSNTYGLAHMSTSGSPISDSPEPMSAIMNPNAFYTVDQALEPRDTCSEDAATSTSGYTKSSTDVNLTYDPFAIFEESILSGMAGPQTQQNMPWLVNEQSPNSLEL